MGFEGFGFRVEELANPELGPGQANGKKVAKTLTHPESAERGLAIARAHPPCGPAPGPCQADSSPVAARCAEGRGVGPNEAKKDRKEASAIKVALAMLIMPAVLGNVVAFWEALTGIVCMNHLVLE